MSDLAGIGVRVPDEDEYMSEETSDIVVPMMTHSVDVWAEDLANFIE